MSETFHRCMIMVIAPDLISLSNLTNMNSTFEYCVKLTTVKRIPEKVNGLSRTFDMCNSLTGEIEVPCTLSDKTYTYSNYKPNFKYYHVDTDTSCTCNS